MSLTPNFNKLMSGVTNQGEVVAPLFRSALMNPRWTKFSIEVEPYEEREPDGWFHPSTHPLWSEQALWWWLVNPNIFPEERDPTKTMAVNVGNMFHDFTQHIGLHHGFIKKQPICGHDAGRTAGWEDSQAEVCLEHADSLSRGHADGELPEEIAPNTGLEIKSMNPNTARRIPQNLRVDDPTLLDHWREMKPDYVAQNFEYMRMRGWDKVINLIIPIGYPFTFIEIHVHRDERYEQEIEAKYRRVRERVASDVPFPLCHSPGTKAFNQCPPCLASASLIRKAQDAQRS